jgi:hypothetical protein
MKIMMVIGILLLPASAFADGNELLKQCGTVVAFLDGAEADISKDGLVQFCAGFMQGITQTNLVYQKVLNNNAQFCLPTGGVTNGQAARIVVKYLRDHPEDLHRNEFVLAFWAFKEAFPCNKGA